MVLAKRSPCVAEFILSRQTSVLDVDRPHRALELIPNLRSTCYLTLSLTPKLRHSGAGSAVLANGQEGTREGRLLSWADEISALVATQRDDLRRSRMELVAAQEVRCSAQPSHPNPQLFLEVASKVSCHALRIPCTRPFRRQFRFTQHCTDAVSLSSDTVGRERVPVPLTDRSQCCATW